MELSYNSNYNYNIAYIRFRPKTEEVEAIKVSDELVVDMAPDGKIYGIELLNANEQLGLLCSASDGIGQCSFRTLPQSKPRSIL